MLSRLSRRFAATHQLRRFSGVPPNVQPAPEPLSEGEQHIYDKLTANFEPTRLQVQDISGGCGTFYAIVIASKAFTGLNVVKQHKLVTETLKQEIEGIHGLQIKTIAQE